MRFHTKGILTDGRSVIVKVNASDLYEADGFVRRELLDAKIDLTSIKLLKVRPLLDKAKSSVYIGKARAKNPNAGAHFRKTAKANGTPSTTPVVQPAAGSSVGAAVVDAVRSAVKGKK